MTTNVRTLLCSSSSSLCIFSIVLLEDHTWIIGKKGWFVCFAIQTGDLRPDLVAYDYSTGISVSVEIESNIEVKSHPEHVRFNMKKWPKLGFEECHVWSSSKTIEKMHKELDELHNKVRTFVVKLPDDYKPKICPTDHLDARWNG